MIKPIGNHILVKAEIEEVTQSGIIIPETTDKDKPQKGVVIAVGDVDIVKPNDTILFKKYSPDEIEIDQQKLLVMEESDILAIINED